jgi:hypothetical protein
MLAAEMLAGAAPGHAPDRKVWWTVRRLPARIVKAAAKAAASREGVREGLSGMTGNCAPRNAVLNP